MKKHFTLFIILIFLTGLSFGQTKMIAHKSHSGSTATFKHSLSLDLFNHDNSNFGQAPIDIIENARLDSVIFLTDSTAVMVTSNYCVHLITEDTTIWQAGRDTVLNHPLFSKKNALDSVKQVLDEDYYFKTPADSTVFIGFDNKVTPRMQPKPQKKRKRDIRKQNRKDRKDQNLSPGEVNHQKQSSDEYLVQKSSGVSLHYLVLILALISFIFAVIQNRAGQKA